LTAFDFGAAFAASLTMAGATDFSELAAWQLSVELRRLVLSVVERPQFTDRALREQMADAAASAPRNIAEGFGRFQGREFAQFLRVAIGSLFETRNHVLDAFDRGYLTVEERDRAVTLSRRAIAATTRLRAYLLSPNNKMSARNLRDSSRITP
jgi:four helix bundle protein